MTVPSPKTEHHPGKAYRVVPIFEPLRVHLEDAFEHAADGEVYVVGSKQGEGYRTAANRPGGWMNANLRTQFQKIIRRAGLKGWPRLFHNLRASCETDLMKEHPIHAVCSWLGNSPTVALRHYLQVLDSDFEKANGMNGIGSAKPGAVVVQKHVQSPADRNGQEMTKPMQPIVISGLRRFVSDPAYSSRDDLMGDTGFEPVTSSV